MIRGTISFKRVVPSITLGCLLAATPVWAAPGDPIGNDACAPGTSLGKLCARKTLTLLSQLRKSLLACHLKQAGLAFKTGMGSVGGSNAEENCSVGNPVSSAKAKFDYKLNQLATKGCDATVIANAQARRDIILGDKNVVGSMDNMNGAFFCDATSGNEIDPGGNDGGWIPSTPENYKCSVVVGKWWVKADRLFGKCHIKVANGTFNDAPYPEEACEDLYQLKVDDKISNYIASGICPPCLSDPPGAHGLISDLRTANDDQLDEVYICPGP